MKMLYWYRYLNKFIVWNVQVFFVTRSSLFCPQNQAKLINNWLKQTFQKAIIYFKTTEQQLFGRNLGCYLPYFQYQRRCIFKLPNTKIRENVPCVTYINLMYQVLTFCSEKNLSNQKVHLRLLKNNGYK